MYAIETENLTKKFDSLTAVDHINLKVNEGEIFGLLGPNGAGKTTAISILTTMKKPSSGKAFVNEKNVVDEADSVRKNIGIVFQDFSLDEELTAYENLDMHAAMYGIPREKRKERIEEVIEIVELKDRLHDLVKTFSGGMRRRLEIARGILHMPKVLFLDEPTIGLDPQTRKHIWEYIKSLQKKNKTTIILTTHYMDEADEMCGRIAIMDYGKIIAVDTSENLKNSLGGDVIILESENNEELEKELSKLKWVEKTELRNGRIYLQVKVGEKRIPQIMKCAKEREIEIESVNLHKPTLDDVFLHYTGRRIREETASGKESMRIRRKAWGRK
ncbi:ATP-binding cassette domain-containing protein [Candidatus Micrarchaeota archaeon]|nr:ATP-binding cassette domain-containing protein [Candidatus Micrarchaeota archaeon]